MADVDYNGRPVFTPMSQQKEKMAFDVQAVKAGMDSHFRQVEAGSAVMQDAEYLLDRYYEQHILPLVQAHLKEYAAGGLEPADVYLRVKEDLMKGDYAEDLLVLKDCWRSAAVKAVGQERYDQVSGLGSLTMPEVAEEMHRLEMLPSDERMKAENVSRLAYLRSLLVENNIGVDVAEAYVNDRIKDRVIDDIADYMKPGNTLSYSFYKIKDESFITNVPSMVKGLAVGGYNLFQNLRGGTPYTPEEAAAERDYAEAMIEKRSLEKYDPNSLERYVSNKALEAVDFATFSAIPGSNSGYGLLMNALFEEGFFYYRMATETVDDADRAKMARGEYVYGKDPYARYGSALFGPASADFWKIRYASAKPGSEDVVWWDDRLHHHVPLPKTYEGAKEALVQQHYREDINAVNDVFWKSFGASGEQSQEMIEQVLIPKVVARGFYVDLGHEVPSWMASKSDAELYALCTRFSSMAFEMTEKGVDTIILGDKTLRLDEVVQRAYDYAGALKQSQERQQAARYEAQARKEHEQQVARPSSGDVDPAMAHRASFSHTADGQPSQAGGTSQTEDDEVRQKRSASSGDGWESLKKMLGLHGAGAAAKNIPDLIANLPDLLMGMFSGRSKHASLNDSLLPLGCVMMGCFVKNPLLRLLLFGFGAMNLLSRFNKDRQEQTGMTEGRQFYRPYDEEPLDGRITQPVVKAVNGGSVLVMKVDGKDYITTLPAAAADAYARGALPLSTLANHVLKVNAAEVETEQLVTYQQDAGQSYDELLIQQSREQEGNGLKV